MIKTVLCACLLVASTVFLHASGLVLMLIRLSKHRNLPTGKFWPGTRLLIGLAWWLILVHLLEISVWAIFYRIQGCMPDLESAFYFSGVTYTTLGYGDMVLAEPWRMLGPVEGLAGILMCGLSTGVFFGVASRFLAAAFSAGQGPGRAAGNAASEA